MKVGIIGAGWIAEKAAITLNGLTDCEAYAIGSRSLEKAEAFASQWNIMQLMDGLRRKWGVHYPMDED